MSVFKKIVFVFCLLPMFSIAQQDPQYSQYMFNQLAINPAYAGSKDALSANAFFRSQWMGIDGAPTTETFSVHSPLRKKKVAVGLTFIGDQIGPKKSVGALLAYAYRIKMRKGTLAFGLRAGIYSFKYDWNQINYKDKQDVYNSQGADIEIAPTADAGMYYYTNSLYVGLSVTHLFSGKIVSQSNLSGDYASLSPHLFFTFGKAWAISDKLVLNPSIAIKGTKGSANSVDVNFSAMVKQRLWMGISLRSSNSIVVYMQVKASDKLKIGYAYDFGYNKIGRAGGATHELMIGYDLNIFKSKMISPRYL